MHAVFQFHSGIFREADCRTNIRCCLRQAHPVRVCPCLRRREKTLLCLYLSWMRWSRVSKKFATYVKVEVYNEERENNPILCFSSTDPNCMPNIGQMSKDGVNQMNSFLKKKQFLYLLYLFYLTVQSQITERCSYIIIISKKNEAVIEHREYLIIIYLKKIEI